MQKTKLNQPILIYMYGVPGSGKSFLSRQISEDLGLAHISGDRLRYELFEDPKHDRTETQIIMNIMNYMTEQFLKNGIGVVYDISVNRLGDRRILREIAKEAKARELGIWIQIDIDSAWQRNNARDRRKSDDKYSSTLSQQVFEQYVKSMQNPQNENVLVVSGKHLYNSQKTTLMRRLKDMGVLRETDFKVAKPELVNLVSRANMQINRPGIDGRRTTIR